MKANLGLSWDKMKVMARYSELFPSLPKNRMEFLNANLTFLNTILIPTIFDFRWMNSLRISTASQLKQRNIANEWSGDGFTVEEAPFLFEVKNSKGNFELLRAPWGHVDDLTDFTFKFLDNLDS